MDRSVICGGSGTVAEGACDCCLICGLCIDGVGEGLFAGEGVFFEPLKEGKVAARSSEDVLWSMNMSIDLLFSGREG